jgi:hypothetical protein
MLKSMKTERFDLNDIQHEPTDEQLSSLMESVAVEARKRAKTARQALMAGLRQDIVAAKRAQERP